MSSNTALNDNLYPVLEHSFKSNPKNIKIFEEAVGAYLDKNISKLSTSGPVFRTLFIESDREVAYKATNTNVPMIKAVIAESSYIKSHWRNISSPFNVICALIISYAKRNKDDDLAKFAVMYLTLSMYPSLHAKYFPFEPDARIMDYTINNLSNKYKIKQLGTMWNALIDTALVCDKTYTRNITRANDKDITDYIEAFKTRLNALLKKIKNEFTKNYNDKNIVNIEKDNEDPDSFARSENNSFIVEKLANAISLQLAISGPDMKIIELSAKLSTISVNDLRTTVTSLVSDKENSKGIKTVITNILFLFLSNNNNQVRDIRSNRFLEQCLGIYKRSNTSDKNIIMIKKLLDGWLQKYSDSYKESNRAATLNNFRRALYCFFMFTIQANSPVG